MQLGSMFICNCNIALHASDAFCVHLQEHLETAEAAYGEWHETGWGIQQVLYTIWLSVDAIDLGRLVGYLNPSCVIHQRLLLQFLSAPDDGHKKHPKTRRAILQLQINILPSCITLVLLYILTYDAQKPKHKITVSVSQSRVQWEPHTFYKTIQLHCVFCFPGTLHIHVGVFISLRWWYAECVPFLFHQVCKEGLYHYPTFHFLTWIIHLVL